MSKYYEIPTPLTLEWLEENAKEDMLSSREMEILLAEHISVEKDFNIELDKFFAENYPDTLINAMNLAFSLKKQPHFQATLDLVKEKPEFSGFYEAYSKIKKEFDLKTKRVEETWQKVKGVRFEKAIMAVNILSLQIIFTNEDEMTEQDIFELEDIFLDAAGVYLNRVKEHWKPIDAKLWNDEAKLAVKKYQSFDSLIDDIELLSKIRTHIFAIMEELLFNIKSFIYDIDFNSHEKENIYSNDVFICDIKKQILSSYYKVKKKGKDFYVSMLTEHFGFNGLFSCNNKIYSLAEFIIDYIGFNFEYKDIFMDDFIDFYEENSDEMSIEGIIVEYDDPPIEVSNFSELAFAIEGDEDNLKLMGTDLSDSKSQIDLKLCNMFYYGQSNAYVAFPYIEMYFSEEYITLLKLLKNIGIEKNIIGENNGIDKTIYTLFKEFPAFSDAKMIRIQDDNIAIYKDKTLILIAVKPTYGYLTFEEKREYEKDLIRIGHKLNKTLEDLQANAKLLYEITESDNVKFDELKIETMIVSNAFEFDGKKFQGHRKLSLLELMIILRDDAGCLSKEKEQDSESEIENFALYSNDNPSVEDFLNALNSGIFEKILEYWK